MYDHTKQYRCTIIRGKAQRDIEDLLPAYAHIIESICPCSQETFRIQFNDSLKKIIKQDVTKKTLDNHRTEIAGKLFGMYYLDADDSIYPSERTLKLLEDGDQPAFFKDICFKMQFPNGMDKVSTTLERMKYKINIRPNSFVLKTLLIAEKILLKLTIEEIGYYILNSLDVLTSQAGPEEVIQQIRRDRQQKIQRRIPCNNHETSYVMQHIKEQINYLELANLVFIENKSEKNYVLLNKNERKTIELFSKYWNCKPEFNVYKYDLTSKSGKNEFKLSWGKYFSELSSYAGKFKTTVTSLQIPENNIKKEDISSTVELGDEGERFVYEYEKERVIKFNKRLVNKVIPLGKTKGLGYDIQSVVAEVGEFSEFVKYIEVKSTKRVTEPDKDSVSWSDSVNMTRNEWIAAQQHKEFYSIYRVYFTRQKVVLFIIENIYKKTQQKILNITPMMYRVDFDLHAVDSVIENLGG